VIIAKIVVIMVHFVVIEQKNVVILPDSVVIPYSTDKNLKAIHFLPVCFSMFDLYFEVENTNIPIQNEMRSLK